MKKIKEKQHYASPAFFTLLGTAGLIGTVCLSVKETPKAITLIKEKKDELGTERLAPAEFVKTVWKCYIPAALLGIGTVACISEIGIMSRHNRLALANAYSMLDKSYRHFREAAKKVYGDDADDRILAEMAEDALVYTSDWGYCVYNTEMDTGSERQLFYDISSGRYFSSTMAAVLNAQYHTNRNLAIRGYVSMDEYLSFLGIEGIESGDKIGWDICDPDFEDSELYWLDFNNRKTVLDDGRKCIVIETVMAPNRFERLWPE